MSNSVHKSPVMLYTEQTPNPETLKFVTNKMLYKGSADFRTKAIAEEWSPLATALFDKFENQIKGVFISTNYVIITKEMNYTWDVIMLPIKEFIKAQIEAETAVVKEGFTEAMDAQKEAHHQSGNYSDKESEIVAKIKDLIETYVKPAVQADGGNIEFKSFHQGCVTVSMQGACSGCPSSTMTLKQGIEGMLQRMIPEVQEVVADMD